MVKLRSRRAGFMPLPLTVGGGSKTGFATIEKVATAAVSIVSRFWHICSVGFLFILLLYWLYGSLPILLLLLFGIAGGLYNVPDLLIYHPDQPEQSRLFVESPNLYGLQLFENLFVRSSDGVKLNMILLKQPDHYFSLVPTILYLHGNAGNVGHRLQNAKGLYSQCGCNVLLLEWRGYGKSEGTPSETGFYCDAQAALNFLLSRPEIDKRKIIIFGRSLGGAVATDLATRPEFCDKILMLIVENTFTSIPEMGAVLFKFPFIKQLPRWCLKNLYDSIEKIKNCRTPSLFISGLADQLVPSFMVEELYKYSGSEIKRLLRFEHGTHNETWSSRDYYTKINTFLDDTIFLLEERRKSQGSEAMDIFETPRMNDSDVFTL